ncbi:hypothetical protein, partial [Bacteroides congonensis]
MDFNIGYNIYKVASLNKDGSLHHEESRFAVCSAWLLATGCKSPMSPNSGNHTANSNGVPRELESERSWRQ